MGILDRLRTMVGRREEPSLDRQGMAARIAALSGQPLPVVEKALQGYSKGPKALLREMEAGQARIDRTGKVWLKEPNRKSVQATVKGVERGIWRKKG